MLNRYPEMRKDIAAEAVRVKRGIQKEFILDHPGYDHSLFVFKQGNPLRTFCQRLVPSAYDDRIFGKRHIRTAEFVIRYVALITTIASIAIAAIATPRYRKAYYSHHGLTRTTWFDMSEVVILAIFWLEAIIKIIADGAFFTPNGYLRSLWNAMDFVILLCLSINTVTSLIYIGGLSRFTRALMATRALRLITLTRLKDTLYTIFISGAKSLFGALFLVLLYILPFAVWG